MSQALSREEKEYNARVREALAFDVSTVPNDFLVECYHHCQSMWLQVSTDSKDTWKYFLEEQINQAIEVWANRTEIAQKELTRRGIEF